jgi:uncharacterized membrane protein YbjE (DUF340 family)
MVEIQHSLNFVTQFDETHPVAQRALALPQSELVAMLEGMLKDLLVPALLPTINEINENGSYAILKVVA